MRVVYEPNQPNGRLEITPEEILSAVWDLTYVVLWKNEPGMYDGGYSGLVNYELLSRLFGMSSVVAYTAGLTGIVWWNINRKLDEVGHFISYPDWLSAITISAKIEISGETGFNATHLTVSQASFQRIMSAGLHRTA